MTYDFNGNVTSATDPTGTAIASWDAQNRLTGLSAPGLTANGGGRCYPDISDWEA